eukprot:COSAG02_NODE_4114_length_5756_cov_2.289376_4_plen_193_part_00
MSCPEFGTLNPDGSVGPWEEKVMDKVVELVKRGVVKLSQGRGMYPAGVLDVGNAAGSFGVRCRTHAGGLARARPGGRRAGGGSRELKTATTEIPAARQQQGGLGPPVSEEQYGHEQTQTWPMQVRLDRAETAVAKARSAVQSLGVTSFYYQPPTTSAFDSYALEQALADTEEELARSKWWWLWLHQWWYRWW